MIKDITEELKIIRAGYLLSYELDLTSIVSFKYNLFLYLCMERKVIGQGNDTLTITLPRDWTRKYNVNLHTASCVASTTTN